MILAEKEIARCDLCGTTLTRIAADSGCLNCLLRAGFEDGPNEPGATRRFQHYELCLREDGTRHELGRGAMGITYLALDANLGSHVALKIISARFSRDAEARERFRREARAAAQLRHPNVASVFHFGETPAGDCFYAMEFIDGETLEARVRRSGPISVSLALEIAAQVARALSAAQTLGLVHRDLKPSNIMLVGNDTSVCDELLVKVIDFGLARTAETAGLIHAGFSGTPDFASPEQFDRTAALDARSDIYSLGATLCYAITGRLPFASRSRGDMRPDQLREPVSMKELELAKVPASVVKLLRAILAIDPAARPQHARQLLDAIQRTREETDGRPRRRKRRLITAAVITLLLVSSAGIATYHSRQRQTAAALLRSVAVLPFENLSPDQESAYLADGMQDEVLTSLGKIKGLKVISRTSVMSYRKKAARNLPQIGKELGVRSVFEGSIRRVADHVLVNVQLTDTATEQHIWAARYDRTLADSLTLQGELAAEIAGALRATLSPQEKARLARKPTASPEAYEFYLRGREMQLQTERSRENYLSAIDFYKRAIALDPKFVLARARLSYSQGYFYVFYDPGNAALLGESKANAEEALRLDDSSAEAHLALARWALSANDRDTARREVAAALRLNPNDASVAMAAANAQQGMGSPEQALDNYERAAELGPREPRVFYNWGLILYYMSRDAEARAVLDHALELAPDSIHYRTFRAKAEISWSGDIARAKSILAALPPAAPDPEGRVISARCWLALLERNFPEALRILQTYTGEKIPSVAEGSASSQEHPPRAISEAIIRLYAGDYSGAYEFFDSIRPYYESLTRDQPDSAEAHKNLAWIYALMRWKEAALAEANRTIELETAAKIPLDRRGNWAVVYAWIGDLDGAWPELQRLRSYPYAVHLNDLHLDPIYDPFRKDPRFQKLIEAEKR
jgi:serine/threonine protein kinase/Flp pilus assembly protein TadD